MSLFVLFIFMFILFSFISFVHIFAFSFREQALMMLAIT